MSKQPTPVSSTVLDGLSESARRWAVPSILLGTFLGNLDASIANVALPTIQHDLGSQPALVVWIVNAYQLAFALAVLPLATLGERIGYRRVFLVGVAGFTLTSAACAMAPSLPILIGARALQGLFGACMSTIVPALLRVVYPTKLAGRAVALLGLVVALSAASGPSVAAGVLAIAHWRWLFAMNLPIGLVAFVLGVTKVPSTAGVHRHLDVAAALLNAVALALLIIGAGSLGNEGGPLKGVIEMALGAAVFALLVLHQRSRPNPLLPIDLLRKPMLALSSATSVCCYMAQTAAYLAMPFLLQREFGRTESVTGLLITVWPLIIVVIAPIAGRLSDRHPAALLCSIGLAILTIGLAALASLPVTVSNPAIAACMAVCGIGFGLFQTPNNRMLLMGAPRERSGAASGLMTLSRTVGMTLGAAMVATLFALMGHSGVRAALYAGAILAALGGIVGALRATQKGHGAAPA
jgi:MFS transporter, DHA2 family, multidrug resistance protein